MKSHRIFSILVAVISLHLTAISPAHAVSCVSGKSTFTGNGTIGLTNTIYTVESFTAVVSGCTWTVPAGVVRVDALIIGGGGGGGSWVGAGGGAGAMIDTTSISVTPGASISITVGDGGAGSITDDIAATYSQKVNGANGSNSIFNSITALGGGVGGSWDQAAGTSTGSGGGGAGNTGLTAGTKADANYGNNGGAGNADWTYGYPTGGGGGAGTAGSAAAITASVRGNSGNGGDGKISTITGTSTYYAGGGGGGCHGNGTYPCVAGTANSGGGAGDAWTSSHIVSRGTNGSSNTGGGGGGSGNPHAIATYGSFGGKGGSGVVIIRYISNLILNPALGSGRVDANTATYRAATAFTINSPINGRATFYEKNKVISTCKNKVAVAGGTLTCTWKPSLRGKVNLRVDYYQTGSNTVLERSNFDVWVNNRSGTR